MLSHPFSGPNAHWPPSAYTCQSVTCHSPGTFPAPFLLPQGLLFFFLPREAPHPDLTACPPPPWRARSITLQLEAAISSTSLLWFLTSSISTPGFLPPPPFPVLHHSMGMGSCRPPPMLPVHRGQGWCSGSLKTLHGECWRPVWTRGPMVSSSLDTGHPWWFHWGLGCLKHMTCQWNTVMCLPSPQPSHSCFTPSCFLVAGAYGSPFDLKLGS